MSFVAVAACIVYYAMDRRIARNYDVPQPSPSDRFVWSDLWRFDRSFWYVIGLCVTFYSVIFPFRSTFAIKYFQHAHGVTLQEAGALNGYVFLAAIVATPLFGLMADRVGHRAAFMAFGCFLLAAVFPILAYTDANLWVSTVMIGIAFSLVPAVIWPAVPYLVEPKSSRHRVRPDDDGAGDGADGDQSGRRRVERRQLAPARRIRRATRRCCGCSSSSACSGSCSPTRCAFAKQDRTATASRRSRPRRRVSETPAAPYLSLRSNS